MNEFLNPTAIVGCLGALGTAAGSIITKRYVKRKNNAEAAKAEAAAKAAELANVSTNLSIYQKLVEDLSKKLETAINEIDKRDVIIAERDRTIERLMESIRERDKQYAHLLDEVEKLTDELKRHKTV